MALQDIPAQPEVDCDGIRALLWVAPKDSRKGDPLRGTSDLHYMYRDRSLRYLRTSTGVWAQGRVVRPPGTG